MTEQENKKVLPVDDSKVSLLMLKRFLAGSEFEVVGPARGGAEAIDQYRALKPNFVLLDIVMPDMGGVEVLEALRGIDANAQVIMVSSLGTKEKVMECMEKGAKSFLMKPYEQEDLLRVLRAADAEGQE